MRFEEVSSVEGFSPDRKFTNIHTAPTSILNAKRFKRPQRLPPPAPSRFLQRRKTSVKPVDPKPVRQGQAGYELSDSDWLNVI